MNVIQWKPSVDILAGTTLRDANRVANNDMALHTTHDKKDILENRNALNMQLGIKEEQWVFAQQTHSDHLHAVTKQDMGRGSIAYATAIKDCDALYTKESGIAIGVFHADCVPILLYDPISQIICAIHAGWQGTVKEITRKSVLHLMQHEQLNPKNLYAYIGPSIAFHSFEVGYDVVEQVQQMPFDTSSYIAYRDHQKAFIDLKGLHCKMLLDLGVSNEHMNINPNDTFMPNESLFSYRRDANCGRHLSYILRV